MVERIDLEGLPHHAVADMIEALSGRKTPATLVELIYSNTEGNPFFIEELYQHLVERGNLLDPSGEFRSNLELEDIDIPQSLRLVISRRLARLSKETHKILGTAAVIGRSFTFELLEAATRTEADWLLDRVEEAKKAGLISSTLHYPKAQFRFSHDLIRRAVLGQLSAPRRKQLNLRIADAIEALYAEVIDDHANDLAHHLQQAGNAADKSRTLKYLALAAARELSQSAYDGALRHVARALPLMELDLLTPAVRVRQFGRGEILIREGERGEYFYVLRHGKVDVLATGADGTGEKHVRYLDESSPQNFFGEIAMLTENHATPLFVPPPTSKCWRSAETGSISCSGGSLKPPSPSPILPHAELPRSSRCGLRRISTRRYGSQGMGLPVSADGVDLVMGSMLLR